MNPKELKNKSEKELQQLIGERRERIRQLRFAIASGKVKNVREIRMLKREIARALTFLNNKEDIRPKEFSKVSEKKEIKNNSN